MPGTGVRVLTSLSPSKFIFEQHRGALGSPLIVLEREQGEHVSHGGFQLGNNFLHAPAEEGIEHHRGNTDGEADRGVEERLANAAGKLRVTSGAEFGAE